jgi:RNA polymerase sigma-70 factor (ECF subfamily)
MSVDTNERAAVEARFAEIFAHLGLLTAYARRRGARAPDEIAAEAMAIAWRRLADVPKDDPRPWLIATARNLVLADRRRHGSQLQTLEEGIEPAAAPELPNPTLDLDPELEAALATLSETDREALLLVAWEDLTPSAAAASLDISPAAFRVRLHRARRRVLYELGPRAERRQPDNRRPSLEQL